MKLPTFATELFQLLTFYVRIKVEKGKSMVEEYIRQAD